MSGITLLNLMVLTGFLMFVESTRDSSVHKDDKVQELIGLLNQLAEGTDQTC